MHRRRLVRFARAVFVIASLSPSLLPLDPARGQSSDPACDLLPPVNVAVDCTPEEPTAFSVVNGEYVPGIQPGSIVGEGTRIRVGNDAFCLVDEPIIVGSHAPEDGTPLGVTWALDDDCRAVVQSIESSGAEPGPPSIGSRVSPTGIPSLPLLAEPLAVQRWRGWIKHRVYEQFDRLSAETHTAIKYQIDNGPPTGGTPDSPRYCWESGFPLWEILSCQEGWDPGWPSQPWVSIFIRGHYRWIFGVVEFTMFSRFTQYETSHQGICIIENGTLPDLPGETFDWYNQCNWNRNNLA